MDATGPPGDDTAEMLRDSLRGFLEAHWAAEKGGNTRRRTILLRSGASSSGRGWAALGSGRDEGGFCRNPGGDGRTGRAACPAPMWPTALANLALSGSRADAAVELIEKLHAGTAVAAFCFGACDPDAGAGSIRIDGSRGTGVLRFVEAASATHLLVAVDECHLALVQLDASGIDLVPTRAMGAGGLCEVRLNAVPLTLLPLEIPRGWAPPGPCRPAATSSPPGPRSAPCPGGISWPRSVRSWPPSPPSEGLRVEPSRSRRAPGRPGLPSGGRGRTVAVPLRSKLLDLCPRGARAPRRRYAARGSPSGAWPAVTPGVAWAGTPSLIERRTDVRRPLQGHRPDAELLLRPHPELRVRDRDAHPHRDDRDHAVHAQGHSQHDPDAAAPARDASTAAEVQGRSPEAQRRADGVLQGEPAQPARRLPAAAPAGADLLHPVTGSSTG